MKLLILAIVLAIVACDECGRAIPGSTTMSRGIDMVKGQTVDTDTTHGSTLPIFLFHCTEGKQYVDATNSSLVFDVPDELTVNRLGTSVEKINDAYCQTYSYFQEIRQSSFSVSAGIDYKKYNASLDAKYSRESYNMKESLSNHTHAAGFSRHYWALFELESYPYELMELDPMFKRFLGMMPKSIKTQSDQEMYNQVVEYFGTHFVQKASMGARIHVDTVVDESFTKKMSISWVKQQFSLQFHWEMFDISAGGFSNRSDIHIDQAFKHASHTFIYFSGGNPFLQNNGTVKEWLGSVPQFPHFLNVTMADLSLLVPEEQPDVQTNLRKTIEYYLQHGEYPSSPI